MVPTRPLTVHTGERAKTINGAQITKPELASFIRCVLQSPKQKQKVITLCLRSESYWHVFGRIRSGSVPEPSDPGPIKHRSAVSIFGISTRWMLDVCAVARTGISWNAHILSDKALISRHKTPFVILYHYSLAFTSDCFVGLCSDLDRIRTRLGLGRSGLGYKSAC
jgi:hypothetical protein